MSISPPKIAFILVLAAAATLLASCGRRGPLEAPPGAAASCAPATATARADGAQLPGQTAANSYGEPPSATPTACAKQYSPRTFFLDPLL